MAAPRRRVTPRAELTMAARPRFPARPEGLPPEQSAAAEGWVRYEDVSQDGRPMLLALPHGLGLTVWQKRLMHLPEARTLQHAGVIPVLTKLAIVGGPGPISVRRAIDHVGSYRFARTVDAAGQTNRIVLEMWTESSAPAGRTHGEPPPEAGRVVAVGGVYFEHVFTRLFAAPTERKVTSLAPHGVADPVDIVSFTQPESLLELPDGARPLDDALIADDGDVVLGVMHTDSNQHVNSLVYPRIFEEACLRRFAARGESTRVLARRVEVAYRRPCSAGERVKLMLRAFRDGARTGAVGAFVADGEPRPRVTLTTWFEP